MARSSNADSASSRVDVPLGVEEIAEVAADFKSFSKDKGRIDHFIRRTYATALALQNLKFSFETELERRARQAPVGTPSNMSPEEAARFLSEAQLTKLFDKFMQQKLGVVSTMRESAESDARQIDAVVDTLRDTVGQLVQDPSVPQEIRQKFALALDQAAAAAAAVPVRNDSNKHQF